jgi:serine phosphatase RsbU (regulator of sigma subunit)
MERNAAITLIRDLLATARRGDIERLTQLYTEDAVALSPLFGEVRGNRAIAETWHQLATLLPDFSAEVTHVLVDGDRIAVLSSVAAVDRIGFGGRPPTHTQIGYKLVIVFTLADGRISREERIYDSAGVVERLEKARLDKELRTAAEVQRTLLAHTRHMAGWSDTVGDSIPCRAIGGDFFAFVDLPKGDIGIMLGDVAGKGPAAALLAAMVQGMFETEAPAGGGPAATLSRINRRLTARRLDARFATIAYGVLSANGELVYSNAGHNPPALITGGGIRRLTAGGPFVGVFDDLTFDEERLSLDAGDMLVLYSDGVTEARNRDDVEFGEERLVECLVNARDAGARAIDRVMASVRAFCVGAEPTDDITVAVTRFAPVAAEAARASG